MKTSTTSKLNKCASDSSFASRPMYNSVWMALIDQLRRRQRAREWLCRRNWAEQKFKSR